MNLLLKKQRGRWTGTASQRGEVLRAASMFDAQSMPRDEAEAAFESAAKLVFQKKKAILDAAADALLETWNDDWRDGARELSAAGLRKRLKLASFTPCELDNPTYLVSVYLDAGDLFGGHSIEVMLEKDGSLAGEPELIG